jgi:hypothetical protein
MDFWAFMVGLAVYCVAAGATLTAFFYYLSKQNGGEEAGMLIFSVFVGLMWPVTAPMILGAWLMFKYVLKNMEKDK